MSPPAGVGLQAGIIQVLGAARPLAKLPSNLVRKALTTLSSRGEIVHTVHFAPNWFADLYKVFSTCNVYLRLCWLKAISGAWCTSARFPLSPQHSCLYGCAARDELNHYLICPVLWQIARESLSLSEDSVLVEERLCCIHPSLSKLQLLAFAHTLYHANVNDTCVVFRNGCLACPRVVQSRAAQVDRNIKRNMILQ